MGPRLGVNHGARIEAKTQGVNRRPENRSQPRDRDWRLTEGPRLVVNRGLRLVIHRRADT